MLFSLDNDIDGLSRLAAFPLKREQQLYRTSASLPGNRFIPQRGEFLLQPVSALLLYGHQDSEERHMDAMTKSATAHVLIHEQAQAKSRAELRCLCPPLAKLHNESCSYTPTIFGQKHHTTYHEISSLASPLKMRLEKAKKDSGQILSNNENATKAAHRMDSGPLTASM